MSYTHTLKYRTELNKEFLRFEVKLVFTFVLVLLLMYTNFYWSLGFLLFFFIGYAILYKFFRMSNNRFVKFLVRAEYEYEEGFPGKDAMISLLGFISVFVIVWILHYYVNFPVLVALIIGLMNIGVANNLASLILWKAKHQYVIYGTTMEFLLLSTLIGFLLFVALGMPYYIALFIAFGSNLFDLIPADHNITTFLVTSLLFILLFI